ncbi:unnamed protein product [Sphagnum balticum]
MFQKLEDEQVAEERTPVDKPESAEEELTESPEVQETAPPLPSFPFLNGYAVVWPAVRTDTEPLIDSLRRDTNSVVNVARLHDNKFIVVFTEGVKDERATVIVNALRAHPGIVQVDYVPVKETMSLGISNYYETETEKLKLAVAEFLYRIAPPRVLDLQDVAHSEQRVDDLSRRTNQHIAHARAWSDFKSYLSHYVSIIIENL